MKITDLIIDPKSLGSKYWLVDVRPNHLYKDGVRTDTIIGYRYDVVLPEKGLEKIGIKIDGAQLLDKPDNYVDVHVSDVEVFIYWQNGQPQVGARAKGIALANNKA